MSARERSDSSHQPDLYAESASGRFYGKYRGVVTENIDPLELGRILVVVPAVPDAIDTWALPCVPYAGEEVGFWSLPPIGANVWVEFEGGNPSYPIWSGGYWLEGEFVPPVALSPEDPQLIKMWKTLCSTFYMNDTPADGGIMLETNDPAVEVPCLMSFDSLGIQLNCGPCAILMNPEEGITISFGENVITLTEAGIAMNGATITAVAEAEASVEAGAAISVEAAADISIAAGGGAELEAGGEVSVAAGGELSLEGGGATTVAAGAELSLVGGAMATLAAPLVNIN